MQTSLEFNFTAAARSEMPLACLATPALLIATDMRCLRIVCFANVQASTRIVTAIFQPDIDIFQTIVFRHIWDEYPAHEVRSTVTNGVRSFSLGVMCDDIIRLDDVVSSGTPASSVFKLLARRDLDVLFGRSQSR
jgi:hypothetical protein